MKFNYCLIAMLSLGTLVSNAKRIEMVDAQAIASDFMAQKVVAASGVQKANKVVKLRKVAMPKSAVTSEYYVFNNENGAGYVVVAGDDAVSPILGYSDSGNFDYENAPEGLKWLLSEYATEIKYIQSNPDYKSDGLRTQTLTKSVAPLLKKISWNQGYPYNNNCPTRANASGEQENTVTGCVATAMAQLMYYHQWPNKGTGSKSYPCANVGKMLTANFDHEYKWTDMTPVYNSSSTDAAKSAVAELMSDCGISVKMDYALSVQGGSAAYTEKVGQALVEYFYYDKGMTFESRGNYRSDEWHKKLRDELDEKRPVLYDGQATKGGHAFIIDGYDKNGYFHVNWGWGGTSNGYFLTTGLTPAQQGAGGATGGFNRLQNALFGCQPDRDGTSEYKFMLRSIKGITSSETKVALGENTTINYALLNNSPITVDFVSYIAICDSNGKIAYKQKGFAYKSLVENSGYTSLAYSFAIPNTVAEGDYQVKILYQARKSGSQTPTLSGDSDNVSDYEELRLPAFDPRLSVNVKGGYATYSIEDIDSKLSATIKPLNKKFVIGTNAIINVTFKNDGFEYYDDVKLVLRKADGTTDLMEFPVQKIGLSKGEDVDLSFANKLAEDLVAGEYKLVAVDYEGNDISSYPITLNPAEAAASFMKQNALSASASMPASNVEATVTLINNGGYFFGPITCVVATKSGIYYYQKEVITSEPMEFNEGEEKVVNFKGSINADAGDVLFLYLRNPVNTTSGIWSNIVGFTVAEEPTSGVELVSEGTDRIYPNPASDVVNVQSSELINGINVYSLNGSKVMSVAGNGEASAQISVADLANGYYFVRVSTSKGISSYKLIKR